MFSVQHHGPLPIPHSGPYGCSETPSYQEDYVYSGDVSSYAHSSSYSWAQELEQSHTYPSERKRSSSMREEYQVTKSMSICSSIPEHQEYSSYSIEESSSKRHCVSLPINMPSTRRHSASNSNYAYYPTPPQTHSPPSNLRMFNRSPRQTSPPPSSFPSVNPTRLAAAPSENTFECFQSESGSCMSTDPTSERGVSAVNRRQMHNMMERKRRNCLRGSFADIAAILWPDQVAGDKSYNPPKVLVLQQAAELIQILHSTHQRLCEDLSREKSRQARLLAHLLQLRNQQ